MRKRSVAVLCIYLGLAPTGWMLQLASPSSLPEAEAEILAALLVVAGAWISGARWERTGSPWVWQAIGSGLLLFGLPSILLDGPASSLPAMTRVAVLALIPAVVVLIATARESGGGDDFLGLLGASLAGLAGAFLLLPADPATLLERPMTGMLMAVAVVSIAVGSYGASVAAIHLRISDLLQMITGPSVVLMGVVGVFRHAAVVAPGAQDVGGLLWRAAETVLLISLIKLLSPVALAARYLLVPLVTAAEGLVYLRPHVSWRMVLGMALLAFGSLRLLRHGRSQEEPPMSLL